MASKRLAVLGMLIAASFLAACAGRPAPLEPTASPWIEGVVSLHARKVETANASPAAEALNADVQRWIEAVGRRRGSPPEVTGDKRAVVASRMREGGEYEVSVWRTARGDQLSGALAGRPFAQQSSENFLRYEKADSSEHIVRLDTWQSISIPDGIKFVHASSEGRWIGFWDGAPFHGYTGIVGGRIVEGRLVEELRIHMPRGAPAFMTNRHNELFWLPTKNAVVLSSRVLVRFDAGSAQLLEGVGRLIGVVEHEGVLVHIDDRNHLSGSRVQDDGSLVTERLDHDPIQGNWGAWLLSPSGHYVVARSGTLLPNDRLIRIHQFPGWGSEFARQQRLLTDWLVIRNRGVVDAGDRVHEHRPHPTPAR